MGIKETDPVVGMLYEYSHFLVSKDVLAKSADGYWWYLSPDGRIAFVETDGDMWECRRYSATVSQRGLCDGHADGVPYDVLGPFDSLRDAVTMWLSLGQFMP
jgi:elongation factor P hydroxylase